jgi:hypothetical protein
VQSAPASATSIKPSSFKVIQAGRRARLRNQRAALTP